MHSGVYSKSETPVNLTLTSSPVESLGRTVMLSLMFWGAGETQGVTPGGGNPQILQPNGAPRGWVSWGCSSPAGN